MKVRLWQIEDRGVSIKFNTMPPGDETGREIFIGRSVIEHISRDRALPNGWIPCTVEIPEWQGEKEGF